MNKLKESYAKLVNSYYPVLVIIWFVVAVVVVVAMMPRRAKFKYEFQKLQTWKHETLTAPFDFPIYKSDETFWNEQQEARRNVHPIFVFDEELVEKGREKLSEQFGEEYAGEFGKKDYYLNCAIKVFNLIEDIGIVSTAGFDGTFNDDTTIDVMKKKVVTEKKASDVYTMTSASEAVGRLLDKIENDECKEFLNRLIINSLRQNIIFSESLTVQARIVADSKVMPTLGMIQKGEQIISKGELVTEEKYNILVSLRKEYENMFDDSLFGQNSILFGQFLLVAVVFLSLYLILKMFHKEVFENRKRVAMIILISIFTIAPTLLVLRIEPEIINMVPVAIAAMVLITFFDARVSILVQITNIMLISLSVPNPFLYFCEQIYVSMVVIFVLSKRKNRSAYFQTALSVFVSYVVVYVGVVLMFDGTFDKEFLQNIVFYAVNACLTLLALPFVFFNERVFHTVTNMTLMELSNTNNPLLRKLASEAPGTFQHVMQVADLCEEVIYKIGGNAMLVRAGALYHDVGKLENPFYFTENQNGGYNPHEDLSTDESAQIIIGHVTYGIELCKSYKIPETIIDFVRTHHGTRFAGYFYKKALQENDEIDENEFRYPGPIPFTKEMAVLMMCDSVEAASRSMREKTEDAINNLVDNIIDTQIKENQFDNTDITYKDIRDAKSVLKKKLVNVYHPRIEYPKWS